MTTPAVRLDFTLPEAAQAPEDQARAQAIAAQKAWRLSEIVGALGAVTVEPKGARSDRADPSPVGGLLNAVKVVRGPLAAEQSGSYGG